MTVSAWAGWVCVCAYDVGVADVAEEANKVKDLLVLQLAHVARRQRDERRRQRVLQMRAHREANHRPEGESRGVCVGGDDRLVRTSWSISAASPLSFLIAKGHAALVIPASAMAAAPPLFGSGGLTATSATARPVPGSVELRDRLNPAAPQHTAPRVFRGARPSSLKNSGKTRGKTAKKWVNGPQMAQIQPQISPKR